MTLFDFRVTDNWNLKTVLALHSGISFIHKQPGRDISILHNNKLSVDGMFVGRGWNQEYHNKGHMLWDNWVELRFPLVTGILAFDLFFDAAGVDANEGDYNNGNYFQGFSIENLRFSYGGGIRFTIPQFPIRLSLAKRFRIVDNKVVWEPGAIGGDPNNPYKGLDLVVSFALAY
jgi:outer membrane protein insertion porin family